MDVTDLKLVDAACKAAGFDWTTATNPLNDDAMAFRLAVRMQFPVHRYGALVTVGSTVYEAAEGEDGYAATRRAIVLEAAELGKESKT